MKKTPAVSYCDRKIKTMGRREIFHDLDNAPLTDREHAFMTDIISGLSIKELAAKYNLSTSRITKWKRELFERLHAYDMRQIRH